MLRIALVTAVESRAHDTDLPLLAPACAAAGLAAEVIAWDDPSVSWGRFDAVVLRSPWNYMERLPAFLDWCTRVDRASRLLNPLPVVRWNTDKHYLADLAAREVPVVPTRFVEPDAEPLPALEAFLATFDCAEFVVKPAVSAGSRDTHRYGREQTFLAANHLGRLLTAGRSAMLQPYLPAVDTHGETALLYFAGDYSHAIRKAALLERDGTARSHTAAPDVIRPCEPTEDERALAERILAIVAAHPALGGMLAYARVDLVRGDDGKPRLLELELCEPALFVTHAPGSAERFAARLAALLHAR
ncbi:MAG TPA: hypothetical protein VEY50_11240 [Lysobacter sp.]|nr:hypothetical protein [Lysobacter sp.]